jgi:Papain family cysteine protease
VCCAVLLLVCGVLPASTRTVSATPHGHASSSLTLDARSSLEKHLNSKPDTHTSSSSDSTVPTRHSARPGPGLGKTRHSIGHFLARSIEATAHSLGFHSYKFGDATRALFKKLNDVFDKMDFSEPLSKYWDSLKLGSPQDAGTYEFKVPAEWRDKSMNDLKKELNGVLPDDNMKALEKLLEKGNLPSPHTPQTKPIVGAPTKQLASDSASVSALLDLDETTFFGFEPQPSTFLGEELASGDQLRNKEFLDKLDKENPLPERYSFYEEFPNCRLPPMDQGRCGACWAFAVSTMLTHQVCREVTLLRKNDPSYVPVPKGFHISPQSVSTCCFGRLCPKGPCGGGVTAAAIMWHQQNGAFTDKCIAYDPYKLPRDMRPRLEVCEKTKKKCQSLEDEIAKLAFSADQTNYVRRIRQDGIEDEMGFLDTNCDVRPLQRALMMRGPMSVSIRTHPTFIGFDGKGVYSSGTKPGTRTKSIGYHAMVLVGWDVVSYNGKKIPCWILTNTWGEKYTNMPAGQQDLVRIVMGTNEMYMEQFIAHFSRGAIHQPDGRKVSLAKGWPKTSAKKTQDAPKTDSEKHQDTPKTKEHHE